MSKSQAPAKAQVKVRRAYRAPTVEFMLRHRDTRTNPGTGFDGGVSDSLS